mmetsp:Transcript_4383/g.17782  ORF Transcript_4383/g.17782 Transcript_4383/m.17782 type:complete len:318 (-) Transcript_4383:3405-4358(-)
MGCFFLMYRGEGPRLSFVSFSLSRASELSDLGGRPHSTQSYSIGIYSNTTSDPSRVEGPCSLSGSRTPEQQARPGCCRRREESGGARFDRLAITTPPWTRASRLEQEEGRTSRGERPVSHSHPISTQGKGLMLLDREDVVLRRRRRLGSSRRRRRVGLTASAVLGRRRRRRLDDHPRPRPDLRGRDAPRHGVSSEDGRAHGGHLGRGDGARRQGQGLVRRPGPADPRRDRRRRVEAGRGGDRVGGRRGGQEGAGGFHRQDEADDAEHAARDRADAPSAGARGRQDVVDGPHQHHHRRDSADDWSCQRSAMPRDVITS